MVQFSDRKRHFYETGSVKTYLQSHAGTLKRSGNGANASTTVFQRRDNDVKLRIHKLQQRSVSNVLIYYDVETYFSMGNTMYS
jgi:hypothetical protein